MCLLVSLRGAAQIELIYAPIEVHLGMHMSG